MNKTVWLAQGGSRIFFAGIFSTSEGAMAAVLDYVVVDIVEIKLTETEVQDYFWEEIAGDFGPVFTLHHKTNPELAHDNKIGFVVLQLHMEQLYEL